MSKKLDYKPAAFSLALAMTGCTAAGGIGAGLSTKDQLLTELLTAPTSICTAALTQQVSSLATLKAVLVSGVVMPSPIVVSPAPIPAPMPTTPTPTLPGPIVTPNYR